MVTSLKRPVIQCPRCRGSGVIDADPVDLVFSFGLMGHAERCRRCNGDKVVLLPQNEWYWYQKGYEAGLKETSS